MKSSKKRSRAVVTVVACILAVCLVAALVTIANRLNKQRKTSRRPHGAKTTGDEAGAKRGGEGAKGPP